MRGCFFIAAAFVLSLCVGFPVLADEEAITNGDFETVTTGDPYDIFDGWTYGWQDTTDGSIMPSTDSVISGDKSVKVGFSVAENSPTGYWHGQIWQDIETGPNWQAEVDFAILTGTARAVGVNVCIDAEGSTDDKERITLKTDAGGNLYVAGGPSAVGGWTDLGLTNALETAGSAWAGQTPVVNHLIINGYLGGTTPYYTITLNGETTAPITFWSYGTGTVVNGSVMNISVMSAYGGTGGGDLNTWLADNVSVTSEDLIPGDANGDYVVDAADAAIVAANWLGTEKEWYHGDFDGNGTVNDIDATLMATNWSAATSAVPEPGCTALLLTLFAAACGAVFLRRS